MSAVVSSVNVVVAGRRRCAPSVKPSSSSSSAKRGSQVVRRATIGDKFKDFKERLPNVNIPDVNLPNMGRDKSGASGGSSSRAKADIGYQPAGGEEYYVGQGKYIEDDKDGFVSKTGRDSQLVGGFAGGEKGLWKYRDVLATDSRLTPERAVFYGARKGSEEVSLAKDFGGMAGGFPGGEIGVKVRPPRSTHFDTFSLLNPTPLKKKNAVERVQSDYTRQFSHDSCWLLAQIPPPQKSRAPRVERAVAG